MKKDKRPKTPKPDPDDAPKPVYNMGLWMLVGMTGGLFLADLAKAADRSIGMSLGLLAGVAIGAFLNRRKKD